LLVVALAPALLAACRGGSESDDTPSVDEIVDSAATAWDETESAHFSLEIEGDAFLDDDETLALQAATGEGARPDSVEASAQVAAGFLVVDVGLIFIGDDAYMTDLITGNWGPAPDDFSYNPAVLFSDTEGLSPVLREMEGVELVGREEVEGVQTYHLRGQVSQDAISELTAGTIEGDPITVDMWFATDDYRAIRIVLSTPEGSEEDATVWTITLSDHNQPVEIEEPTS
jgi:hypothetical protein